MIGVVYYEGDPAAKNTAEALSSMLEENGIGFSRDPKSGKGICMMGLDGSPLYAERLDDLGFETIYFLSKHSSAQGIGAFTTHPEGNWQGDPKLGGKPYELSFSAPVEMLDVLRKITKVRDEKGIEGIEASYEATHHGPPLKTPSLFVELGGNQSVVENKELAGYLATALLQALENKDREYAKVVIGIGGTHYPRKFSQLAVEKGYAFAHMMPKYAIDIEKDNLHMLRQAVERVKARPEVAVIEWKSMNAGIRDKIIEELNKLGMDYEKV